MVEHQHRAVRCRQPAERALERIRLADPSLVRCAGLVDVEDADLDPPSATTEGAIAAANQDAPYPGVKRIGIAQRGEVAPDLDQRLLDGIVGRVIVTNNQTCRRVEAPDDLRGDLLERRVVASLCLQQELVRGSTLVCRGTGLAIREYVPRVWPGVPSGPAGGANSRSAG